MEGNSKFVEKKLSFGGKIERELQRSWGETKIGETILNFGGQMK